MPKISVIIPVYNVEKYIPDCLDSLCNQTLTDIEIICINDGSTDGSLKILQEYAEKDNRIIIINQENQGQGVARNNGIDIASGEYIAFVDPDDFIDLDSFGVVYSKFKETNVDIIQFDYQTCDENKNFMEYHTLSKEMKKVLGFNLNDNQVFCLKDFKQANFIITRWCATDKIYSTNFIKQNNIKFSPSKNGEDNIFSFSSTLLANKILYINKYLYHYRMRQGSAIHKLSDNNFGIFENVKLLKDFLVEHNLYETYKKTFYKYSINAYANHYGNIPETSNESFLNECKKVLNEEEYKDFLNATKPNCNFLQKIFSIKNTRIHGIKYKYLYILGLKFIIYKKEISY